MSENFVGIREYQKVRELGKIQWADRERFKQRDYGIGDQVFHEDLLLGIITEIKKPWFEQSYCVLSLSSLKAQKFIDNYYGLNDFDNLRFVKAPLWLKWLRKLKRIVHSLHRSAKVNGNE